MSTPRTDDQISTGPSPNKPFSDKNGSSPKPSKSSRRSTLPDASPKELELQQRQQPPTAGVSSGSGLDSSPNGRSPPRFMSPKGDTIRRRRSSLPSNPGDIPGTIHRVINYFIDSAPPGQLPTVVNSCREILLGALPTMDTSILVATVAQAAEKACMSRVERYVERELLVIPFTSSIDNDGLGGGEFDEFKTEAKKRWSHTACVVSRGTRCQSRKAPYRYLFTEGRFGVQIDPMHRRITDIVPLIPSLDLVNADDLLKKLDHPHRVTVETVLRQFYLPQHFPLTFSTALSVHLLDSPSSLPSTPSITSPSGSPTPHSTSQSSSPAHSEIPTSSPRRRLSLPPSQLSAGWIHLQVIIAVENINPANYWGGSWKSVWEVEFDPSVEKSATAKGKIKVKLQYTENGSICLRQQLAMCHDINHTENPNLFARDLMKAIAEGERRVQRALEKLYLAIHIEILRNLRRLVPVSGCKFDWTGGYQAMTNDITAINVSRQLQTPKENPRSDETSSNE